MIFCAFNNWIAIVILIATIDHANRFSDDLIPSTRLSIVSIKRSDWNSKPVIILASQPDFPSLFQEFLFSAIESACMKGLRVLIRGGTNPNKDSFHTVVIFMGDRRFTDAYPVFLLVPESWLLYSSSVISRKPYLIGVARWFWIRWSFGFSSVINSNSAEHENHLRLGLSLGYSLIEQKI